MILQQPPSHSHHFAQESLFFLPTSQQQAPVHLSFWTCYSTHMPHTAFREKLPKSDWTDPLWSPWWPPSLKTQRSGSLQLRYDLNLPWLQVIVLKDTRDLSWSKQILLRSYKEDLENSRRHVSIKLHEYFLVEAILIFFFFLHCVFKTKQKATFL